MRRSRELDDTIARIGPDRRLAIGSGNGSSGGFVLSIDRRRADNFSIPSERSLHFTINEHASRMIADASRPIRINPIGIGRRGHIHIYTIGQR